MHRIGIAVALVCAASLAIPTVAVAQDAGIITLIAQERIVEARTSEPPRLESLVAPGPGIINPVRRIEEGRQFCAPRGGCTTVSYTVSRSEQRTAINMAPNGALHVQGYEDARAGQAEIRGQRRQQRQDDAFGEGQDDAGHVAHGYVFTSTSGAQAAGFSGGLPPRPARRV